LDCETTSGESTERGKPYPESPKALPLRVKRGHFSDRVIWGFVSHGEKYDTKKPTQQPGGPPGVQRGPVLKKKFKSGGGKRISAPIRSI